jgi:hypothetical protein
VLTGQECERSRRQQALHCGHSGKSGQRGRRVATGLRGYGACEAAEGVVQKSGAKDESSRSGTLTFNGTHASERGAAARKVEWGPALREFENFVGSRFTPACNTSELGLTRPALGADYYLTSLTSVMHREDCRISPETSPKARILILVSGSAAFVVPHPPQTRTV